MKPCIHAEAVSYFSAEEQLLDNAELYVHASDVTLDDNPVVLIHSGSLRAKDLLLSVSSNAAGWPRSVVGSMKDQGFSCLDPSCRSKGRRFKCEHCLTASQWLNNLQAQLTEEAVGSTETDTLSDLAAEFEGMHLYSEHASIDADLQQKTLSSTPAFCLYLRSRLLLISVTQSFNSAPLDH